MPNPVRVIAVVLVQNGNVVQTKNFRVTNIVGNAKTAVKFFAAWDADEIVLIDISPQPWEGFLSILEEAASNIFIPLTVGGHISTHEQIRELQLRGADKVLIRRACWRSRDFVKEVIQRHGAQMVVAGLDWIEPEQATRGDELHWIYAQPSYLQDLGVGEILLNHKGRDGTKEGFDLNAIKLVSRGVRIPVIAMGGAGKPEHFVEAVKAGADAVAAGNLFHYMEHATVKAKQAMKNAGITVREARLAVL